MKNKIYIAGSLFKESDIVQRKSEEKKLKSLNPNLDIFNPINADVNDKSKLPTAEDILTADFNQVKSSNIIMCALDDDDLGQATEIGMVFGLNYILLKLKNLIENKEISNQDINTLLEEIPIKKIYGHLSDIRQNTAHFYQKHYVPYGINQFLIGAVEKYGEIFQSCDDCINKIINDTKNKN